VVLLKLTSLVENIFVTFGSFMSKIGSNPIKIEDGVTVSVDNSIVTVSGPKGELKVTVPEFITVKIEDGQVTIEIKDEEEAFQRSMHGTVRMLIANAVTGVKDGYKKKLEIHGVGFRVKPDGAGISMSLGLNHPVVIQPAEGITLEVPDETSIVVSGINKQLVGEFAAKIREIKKPEPYKGKGIRYEGEYVRRKSAKSAKA
jgi:large subunit ribosomal protein L6